MSVSSDHAFPLFQQAFSGNTADVGTYVQQWHNLIDLLGYRDFLYVADSKLISHETMAHINDNDGFFIAPAPMYKSYREVFENALDNHDHELLIAYKDRFNRGFEVPMSFEYEQKQYQLRMIILFDHGLCPETQNHRLPHRSDQGPISGTYQKTQPLQPQNRTRHRQGLCKYLKIQQHRVVFQHIASSMILSPLIKTNTGAGPPKMPCRKRLPYCDHFRVQLDFDQDAYLQALSHCGYYPLLTNKQPEDLSIEDAMLAHKKQYKSEHTYRRAKGPLSIEPIYLHTPERIESLLFLFKMALQMVVLIERTARKNIQERDRGLDGFMPNRKDVRNPKSEYLLKEFEDIVSGCLPLADGQTYCFISELTPLQREILSILQVPLCWYEYGFLFDSS
jgi:transposase